MHDQDQPRVALGQARRLEKAATIAAGVLNLMTFSLVIAVLIWLVRWLS